MDRQSLRGSLMPIFGELLLAVEFLTDEQALGTGPSTRCLRGRSWSGILLDGANRERWQASRRSHNRLGFVIWSP